MSEGCVNLVLTGPRSLRLPTMASSESQSLEDISHPQTSAAVITCVNDDEEFIRNVRKRKMVIVDGKRLIKGGKRVIFLWQALYRLPASLRRQIFLQLLQGNNTDDI
ncbi:hypothetical protein C8J56DRAFT_1051841 [Mycena floridula]|nr:hypothetical protein C8J56DRAFT_1051841 [Mycena floridula]